MKQPGKPALIFSGVVVLILASFLWLRVSKLKAQQASPLSGSAPQVTGTPGSPTATTTINGQQLPPMPQPFHGKIERNAAESTPYWPPYWPARVVPPKGAPNVLLIMTDDTGFGVTKHLRRRNSDTDS